MPFGQRVAVLVAISLIMTVGVYGLVAGIVKLDDAGLHLSKSENAGARGFGKLLLLGAPKLMKTLSVVGTAAMFMVGGGILVHGVPALHHVSQSAAVMAGAVPGIGGVLAVITPTLFDAVIGVLAGALALLVVSGGMRLFKRKA